MVQLPHVHPTLLTQWQDGLRGTFAGALSLSVIQLFTNMYPIHFDNEAGCRWGHITTTPAKQEGPGITRYAGLRFA